MYTKERRVHDTGGRETDEERVETVLLTTLDDTAPLILPLEILSEFWDLLRLRTTYKLMTIPKVTLRL